MKEALAELVNMDREALAQRWQEVFGHPAPLKCRAELLRQALAWQCQAARHGDLTGAERRQLRGNGSPSLSPGSRLIRVWQGDTHQVSVLDEGFLYSGKRYQSLSAIARAITGTPWSGPVFFGLKKT
jgi:hypothetical protein